MTGPPTEPRSYRVVNLVLDGILARARWLLLPIGLLVQLGRFAHTVFWLLCNEHTKSKFASCGDGVRIYGGFSVTARVGWRSATTSTSMRAPGCAPRVVFESKTTSTSAEIFSSTPSITTTRARTSPMTTR